MIFNKRKEYFGKTKILFNENIIASYSKDKPEKYLSKAFVKKVKAFNGEITFTDKEQLIMSKFKEFLLEIIEDSQYKYKKDVFIVLPPSKPGKINHTKEMMDSLNLSDDVKMIEFHSDEYNLKEMSKSERIKYLNSVYKTWKVNETLVIEKDSSKLFFIFVDDIVTTGTTSFFTMKAVKEYYEIDGELLYRSLYLMGTQSPKWYKENKKYHQANIWKK